MFRKLKVCTFALLAFGFASHEAAADETLLNGIRPFMCDGEAIVLLEADNGWVISTDPTAEVKSTDNGWRYEDTLSGTVWYLREESRNSWVIDGLSKNGHFELNCVDLAESVSHVVTIIKPRLDKGILNIEAQLLDTQAQLAEGIADYLIAIQRAERLCIWLKTYQHLDALEASFPFEGKQHKLCN